MKLYSQFLKKLYPKREIYFEENKFFITYETDLDQDIIIYDIFMVHGIYLKDVIRFISKIDFRLMVCSVDLFTPRTEKILQFHFKMGLTIYKVDAIQKTILLSVYKDEWIRNVNGIIGDYKNE